MVVSVKMSKQCLSDTPRTVMKTNIKMVKFEKQLFNLFFFFFFCGMTLLHAYVQYMYIYIVNATYQKASVKALVQVDFPIYAQAKSLFKIKQVKMADFTKLLFFQYIYIYINIYIYIYIYTFILASNIFMRMFNESILCMHSLNCFGTTCDIS